MPLLPRLFPVDCIRVLQAQFFDNSASPPKQGQSQFALKLFAWTEGTIDFQQPHWWRVVQLLARISHTFCDPGAIWSERVSRCKSLSAAGQADPFRQSDFQPPAGRLMDIG